MDIMAHNMVFKDIYPCFYIKHEANDRLSILYTSDGSQIRINGAEEVSWDDCAVGLFYLVPGEDEPNRLHTTALGLRTKHWLVKYCGRTL
mmetsp:Transcript_4614/g.8696  ORF Transcript_4614/g.8696 Transcript_4614/m.8696 type:complete len:90 (+) Transcript_4614:5410-5679(+)